MATLVIENGTTVSGANSYATSVEFDAYIADRAYSIPAGIDKEAMLIRSFEFMAFFTLCVVVADSLAALKNVQCEIARNISDGFDLSSKVDEKQLKSKGIGRGAIAKTWDTDKSLSGTDSKSILRRMPVAFNAFNALLCSNARMLQN